MRYWYSGHAVASGLPLNEHNIDSRQKTSPMSTTCPSPEELKAFSLGTLASPTFDRLAHHVERCSNCDAVLRGFDGCGDGLVSELRRFEPPAETPIVPAEWMQIARGTATST